MQNGPTKSPRQSERTTGSKRSRLGMDMQRTSKYELHGCNSQAHSQNSSSQFGARSIHGFPTQIGQLIGKGPKESSFVPPNRLPKPT